MNLCVFGQSVLPCSGQLGLEPRADWQLDRLQFLQFASRGQSRAEGRHEVGLLAGPGLQMVVRASHQWTVEGQVSHGGQERTASGHRGQQVGEGALRCVLGPKTPGKQEVLRIEI